MAYGIDTFMGASRASVPYQDFSPREALHRIRQSGDENEPDENEPDEDEPDEDEPDEDEGGHGHTTATKTVSVESTTSPSGSLTSDQANETGRIDSERRSSDDNDKSRSIALGIVIPVLVICLIALAFWYRKRRQNEKLMRDARERRMRDPLLPMANKPTTAGMQTLASRPSATATTSTMLSPHTNSTSSRCPMAMSPPAPVTQRSASSPAAQATHTAQTAPHPGPSSSADPLPNPHSDNGHESAAQHLDNIPPATNSSDALPPSTDREHPTIDIPTCLQPGGGKSSPPVRRGSEDWLPSRFHTLERNVPHLYYSPSLDKLAAQSAETSPNLSEEHPPAVQALELQATRREEDHPPPFQGPSESDCPSAFSVDEKGRTRLSWRRLSSRLSGEAGGRRSSSEGQGRVTPSTSPVSPPADVVSSPTSISSRRRSAPPQVDKALPSAPQSASSTAETTRDLVTDKTPARSSSIPTTRSPVEQGSSSRGRSQPSFGVIGQRSPFFEFVAATGQDPARAKKGKRDSTSGAAVVRRETRQTGPPAYAEAMADGSTVHGHGTL
ncbi:uncharacterized protein SCHCODRAFT_02633142 [Schizophyllum commune H4-8]|uniref:uncharacterized protein n=1 Tax=Schizophyllum commune (strain H4-8 / FGSC 9210) TaxID=578458 RepID=UPI0021600B53|nr:uncharacterized protein SCHCODRAFT_02633142 [Schizophyllum commune H4-8]KAI5888935.1 hypothetical protein SCHCODRAFT_02633142 [Schizophyllum commune H4-8]